LFLALVHLREARCAQCGAVVAAPGSRSFVVGPDGTPVEFSRDDPPAEMTVEIDCPNGHGLVLYVPNEIAAEETLYTPQDAPLANDARLVETHSESGAALSFEGERRS
jgi:predicted component of type VI protein secretion system